MSGANQWMPLYIGDYLRDTQGLQAAEHGAYLLLLMSYWSTGPLPDDDRVLRQIACCTPRQWSAMRERIRGFFEARDGLLYQSRMERERERVIGAPAPRRGRASNPPADEPMGDANATSRGRKCATSPPPQAFENPESRSDRTRTISRTTDEVGLSPPEIGEGSLTGGVSLSCEFAPRAGLLGEEEGFEEFWRLYPRKVGKGQAKRAWKSALRKKPAEAIILGLNGQLRLMRGKEARYIPHPSTWLNGERWSDDLQMEERAAAPPRDERQAFGDEMTRDFLDGDFAGRAPPRRDDVVDMDLEGRFQ